MNNQKISNGLKKASVALFCILIVFALSACSKQTTNIEDINTINQSVNNDIKITDNIDISSHNTESDCWTMINGKIYNITEYISSKEHPSGNSDLISICGKDGTEAFSEIRKHNSSQTSDVLNKYIIK